MQEIYFHKNFWKSFDKLPKKIKGKVKKRIELFAVNSFHPLLNNHSLSGKIKGFRSINITGDYRAIYKETETMVVFSKVGTHSQLYN